MVKTIEAVFGGTVFHPTEPIALSTGGEPPAMLADLKYADLVRDWSAGVAELLRAIR